MQPVKNTYAISTLISAAALTLIELLCFLPIMRKVGFYFDDWATLSQLFFSPRQNGLWSLICTYGYNNSLVIIRPIEALHFGTAFWFFGLNPFPWHVFNIVLEILVALLTGVILKRLTDSRALGFFAAVFMILCPSHDSSHYWIVCSSVTLSLVFYLASLHSTLLALKAYNSPALHGLSAAFFACSLFNYETFMPLALINVLLAICSSRTLNPGHSRWSFALPTTGAMILPVVLLLCYLKVVIPRISSASMRAINFDPTVFCTTIFNGVALHLSPQFLQFTLARASEALQEMTSGEWLRALAITIISGGLLFVLSKSEQFSSTAESLISRWQLVWIGLAALLGSYTIFGLCPDYPPTFMTYLNRINTGASFAICLSLTGLLGLLLAKIASLKTRKILSLSGLSVVVSLLFLLFTLANFGLAKAWIVSWTTQKHIQEQMVKVAPSLPPQASLLLLNCPRYVMWAPVYDGIWDFRNTARILLKNKDFNAGVVSERLQLTKAGVRDISRGTICGDYPFSTLYLLIAPECKPERVENASKFAQVVESQGMGFGLERGAVDAWKTKAQEK